MATGTTLTISTNHSKNYKTAVASSDAGTPSLGSPTFIYDDDETQSDLLHALEKAKLWVLENVPVR